MSKLQPHDQSQTREPSDTWFPLEAELKQDDRGERRDALVTALRGRAADLKRRLDKGLPPEEFSSLQRIHAGLEAAVQVVELVWIGHHGDPGRSVPAR